MRIGEITSYLESIAPRDYQEGYDNSGLIVGNANDEVEKVLVSLDVTEPIIDEAIEKGCGLVIAHHPIVFGGLKQLNGKNYVERTVLKAIRAGVAIYAIHTNLDNVTAGVNAEIARRLGVANPRILAPKKDLLTKLVVFVPTKDLDQVRDAIFSAGGGRIGKYDECSYVGKGEGTFRGGEGSDPHVGSPGMRHVEEEMRLEVILPRLIQSKVVRAMLKAHPYEEVAYDLYPLLNEYSEVGAGMVGDLEAPMDTMAFLASLKDKLNTSCVRHTKVLTPTVQRIAFCGGAGSFLLGAAKSAGADVFITGDYKYHQFFDAEEDVIIADVGHYESEQYTKDLIKTLLMQKFHKFAVLLSEVNTNPINYL